MKKIVAFIAFLLFSVVAFAGGEQIVLRFYVGSDISSVSEVYIYEGGNVSKVEVSPANRLKDDKRTEAMKAFGDLLAKYGKLGYRVVSAASVGGPDVRYSFTDYILEKE